MLQPDIKHTTLHINRLLFFFFPLSPKTSLHKHHTRTRRRQAQHLHPHSRRLPRRPRARGRPRTSHRTRSRTGRGRRAAVRGPRRAGRRSAPAAQARGRRGGRGARHDGGHGDALGLADLCGESDGARLVGVVAGADEAAGDVAEEGLVLADALWVGAAAGVGAAGELLGSAALLFCGVVFVSFFLLFLLSSLFSLFFTCGLFSVEREQKEQRVQ